MTLDELRVEIDAIDDEIAPLLARRMAVALQVAEAKRQTGAPVFQKAREEAILARLGKGMDPHYQPALHVIYEAIFRVSRELQEGLI